MKRLISLVVTMTMLITACLPLDVSAKIVIDTDNNTFSIDYEGTDIGRVNIQSGAAADPDTWVKPDACVTPAGDDDNALRMIAEYSTNWVTTAQWNSMQVSAVDTPIVKGDKIQISFSLRVDSSSAADVKTGVCQIGSTKADGTKSGMTQFLLQLQCVENKWYINVYNNDKKWSYQQLCEIKADTWQDVVLVIDLKSGSYDAYSNGSEKKGMTLIDESWNSMSALSNLLDIQFKNNKHAQTANKGSEKIGTSIYYIDDLYAKELEPMALKNVRYIGETGSEVSEIMPHSIPVMLFNNSVKNMELYIDSAALSSGEIVKQGNEYLLKHTTPFSWNTEHKITGTVTDILGSTLNINESFTIAPAPEQMIEVIGFTNSDGAYISSPESGRLTAKLRFWQQSQKDYLYMMVLYGKKSGKDVVVNLVADEASPSAQYFEDTLEFVVPEDVTQPCIKLMVWDSLNSRQAYPKGIFKGTYTLK